MHSGTATLKRRVFPSTLYESGRRASRAGVAVVEEAAERGVAAIVLHTSYLGELAVHARRHNLRSMVDVYDLLWRVHAVDARQARGLAPIRMAYGASIRPREMRSLRVADRVIAAGWNDAKLLARDIGRSVAWIPTGLQARPSTAPNDQLAIGIIGNFEHSATAVAAKHLLTSPIADDPSVTIVFAGLGSDQVSVPARVRTLGRVEDLSDFYSRVHATVVPVDNGSGMKCKLAEAALAGKLVVTTPEGAIGYPPELRSGFMVVPDIDSLRADDLRAAAGKTSLGGVADLFASRVAREVAAQTYRKELTSLMERKP